MSVEVSFVFLFVVSCIFGFRSPLSSLLCFIMVVLIICVSLWCFVDEVENPYADQTDLSSAASELRVRIIRPGLSHPAYLVNIIPYFFFFFFFFFLSDGQILRPKYLNEGTQERPQTRNTALLKYWKKKRPGTNTDKTITKTYLYNVHPLNAHFYIVKRGFTGLYIIFLISAQKHRLWVLIRTASARQY